MDPDQAVRLEQLQAGLEQELLHERVPDLHRRALALALLVELRARHGGAVDAVAAGARADVDHGVPCSARRAAEDAIRLEQPERERVHQAVAVERCVEGDLARDRGNADAVAVPGDPGHHSLEQPRGPRMRRIAESQRVHRGDRPRAHGEHVAQDAAHSRCGALIRLDVARMVVALHLEGDGQAATDVDHTGVLAGTLQYPRTLCREVPEQAPARLVRAMLAPHGGKDAQLHDVRVAPEHLADARILVLREAVRRYDLGGAGRHGSRNIPDRKPGGVTTDLRKGCKKPPVALRSGSMTRVEGEDQSRLAEAERRQRILSEVSRVLLDYVGPDEIEPLRRIVHQVTDALANDWCAFALVQPDGTLKNVATYHPDPRQRELAKKLDVLVPPRRWDVGPAELNPFLERRPIVTEEITDEMLRAAIPSEDAFQALKEIGLTSAIVVPMFDGSEPLGRLLLASTGKGRRYSNEDVDFAYSLAGRAALGVRNARLVRELARQRDIQSHERAEADRRFAELRAVFDSDPNGIALFDAAGVLRMASHRIEEIFGLPLRAMYGQRFDEIYHQKLAQVAAQDREAMLERVRGIFANQETRAHDEIELERPHHRWLTRSSVPVRGGSGEYLGRLVVYVDVTEQRELDRQRSDFLTVAAHELRTPLTPLSMYLHSIERRLKRGQSIGGELVSKARRQVERLGKLVEDLLDVSRLESRRMQLSSADVEMNELADDVVADFRAQTRNHDVFLRRAGVPVVVEGDRERLEQVLVNLISNAIKYTPQGGRITVSVDRAGADARA